MEVPSTTKSLDLTSYYTFSSVYSCFFFRLCVLLIEVILWVGGVQWCGHGITVMGYLYKSGL